MQNFGFMSNEQQERITYSREVQTMPVEMDAPSEDEVRQRILLEQHSLVIEIEKAREQELEQEDARLEAEIEQEIKGFFLHDAHVHYAG